jgi:signal transduction histidine kinase
MIQEHADTRDISCMVVKPALQLLSRYFTRGTLRELAEDMGLSLEYLEREDNWISYDSYLRILRKLKGASDARHEVFQSGVNLVTKDSFSFLYYLFSVLKVFNSPRPAYAKMAEYRSIFTHVDSLEVLSADKNRLTVRYILGDPYRPDDLNCEMVRGQLAAVPLFWNLPPAEVNETQCQAAGAPACVFEVRWQNRRFTRIVTGLVLAGVVGLELLYFLVHKNPLLSLRDVVISGLVLLCSWLGLALYRQTRHKSFNKTEYEKRVAVIERAIYEGRREYLELQRANQQIIEKANKLSMINRISAELIKYNDEDMLLQAVMKLIVENLDFDVGFCLSLDSGLKFLKQPFIYTKQTAARDMGLDPDELFLKKGLEELVRIKSPAVVQSTELFKNVRQKEVLAIPLCVRNAFYYVMLFYNYGGAAGVDTRGLDFFNTITYQLDISLDNIYASKAPKTIIASIPSSLVVFNGYSHKISFINPSCLQTMGVSQTQALGKGIVSFLKIRDPLVKKNFKAQIKKTVGSELVDDQELRIGDQVIGFTLFKMPAVFGGGNEVGMIMKNITEQKEIKEQLFRAEKLAALGTLVSGIAHEINNPLYGVLGSAEIIRDEARQASLKTYARDIIEFITQASDIVKDLSSYTRDLREDKPGLVDINGVMDDALRIVKYSKNFVDIDVQKKYEKVSPVFARVGELRQVYINLLTNALQAMNGKGVITLVSRNGRDAVETQVTDTGSGIPEKILPKIFDPFFTTKETGKGTGLGLNIVYRLVTQNNGVISVRSAQGRGTVFTIKYFLNKVGDGQE